MDVEKMSSSFSSQSRLLEQSVQVLTAQVSTLGKEKQTVAEELKYLKVEFQDAKKAKEALEREVQLLQAKDTSNQRQIQMIQSQLVERLEQIKKLKLGIQQARKVTATASTRRHPQDPMIDVRYTEEVGVKRERVPRSSVHSHPPS